MTSLYFDAFSYTISRFLLLHSIVFRFTSPKIVRLSPPELSHISTAVPRSVH